MWNSRGGPTNSGYRRRTDAQVLWAQANSEIDEWPAGNAVAHRLRNGSGIEHEEIEASMDVVSLHDNSLPNCVENNLRRVVQIELLHQIGSVGLDR